MIRPKVKSTLADLWFPPSRAYAEVGVLSTRHSAGQNSLLPNKGFLGHRAFPKRSTRNAKIFI